MRPLVFVFSFIPPDNSAQGTFVFTTGGRLLLSFPFPPPSSFLCPASSLRPAALGA